MPIYIKEDKVVLFVHVPKAGGSTIERCFREAEWEEFYLHNPGDHPDALRRVHRCNPQHWHAKMIKPLFWNKRFDVSFMTVRHPMSRLCSEYGMRNTNASVHDVDAFLQWMEDTFERHEKNPFVLDNHIRPQKEFLLEDARWFKLEEGLESIIQRVAEALDDAPLENHSVHSSRRGGKSFARMQDDPRVIDGVRSFYAEDLEHFDYTL